MGVLRAFAVMTMIAGLMMGTTAEAATKLFYVRDYGALPDSHQNSHDAITKAINAAVASGAPAEVVFGRGEYRIRGEGISNDPQMDFAFQVSNARDLTIRGQGNGVTRLVFTNPKLGGFRIIGCQNIQIKDFSVDYDPVPLTQGMVVAVDHVNRTWDLKIDPGYLELDNAIFSQAKVKRGNIIHANGKIGGTIFSSEWTKVGDRTWRMKQSGNWWYADSGGADLLKEIGMEPGVRYYHMARNYGMNFCPTASKNVTFEGITVYASPSCVFWGANNEHVTVRNCHTSVPNGSGRLAGPNGDAVHLCASRGPVTVEDCSFEKQSDDCINLIGVMQGIMASPSPDKIVVGNVNGYREGDSLTVLDSAAGAFRGSAKLKRVDNLADHGGKGWQITLDQAIRGIRPGKGQKMAQSDIVDLKDADVLCNMSTRSTPFLIRRNHLMGQGALFLSVAGGLIEDNVIERDFVGRGITLGIGWYPWYEGPAAQDVAIRGNTFIGPHRTYGKVWSNIASICLDARSPDGKLSKGLIQRIRIENNRFSNPSVPAIAVRSARDVTIKDNVIECLPAAERAFDSYSSVVIDESEGVVISGLKVTDADPRHKAVVDIKASVTRGDSGVKIDGIEAAIAQGAVDVLDERKPI